MKVQITTSYKLHQPTSSRNQSKAWSFGLRWVPFVRIKYKVSAKKVQKSYLSWQWRVMQSLKKKLTCGFKYDIRNLVNFHPTAQKPKKFLFDGLFLFKVYKVWATKMQRSYLSWHWRVMQQLKENWLLTWNDVRNLVNFYTSSQKSDNLHFDGLVLSKAYKVLDEKVQKS